ncbi:hypothetical protein PtA15_18A244 [Puccinia triticina]|uniref:Up-regulated during septation protein 1 domain-containing protein n=1 Tax=Puccinia triticina TaxID=208348 RepID=A0ABY7D690_9BASI|nr:uncharacterized protein PtA15_18A244 [Puccinia triticina]WAQ93186.1 hypothetical protein PtA15_18A244 [Puccinia triticina]
MSTFASTRLRQSSSNSTFEPLDPTTLAISLIPLLPPHLSREASDHQSPVTLPVLAASLSTLPHNVINAINFLAQELKSLREQQVLFAGGSSHPQGSPLPSPDGGNPERENRERWLENQKVNHLKKSISSLTNLQSTLQSRLLTTVDTLSDLQQTHQRETQQLTDERDGVRAVNQVLKRKIAAMDKQLRESKEVMESVLERVEVVNKGDWSIVEHGAIQVFSPLPPSSPGQDHSLLSEDLCTFHLQCQADNPTQMPHLLSSRSSSDGQRLARSTGSETQRNNQRSITLIAELTEELESLRREIKVELKLKHDEISRLNGLIDYRDDEIRQLMARLQHFMGLDGFYEATPRQKIDQNKRSQSTHIHPFHTAEQAAPMSQSRDQRQLEEEIKQLEIQLKEVTQSSQFGSPMDDRSSRPTRVLDDLHGQSATENNRSSAIPVDASDNKALWRFLGELSKQVANLKSNLKDGSKETDALRRKQVRRTNSRSSSSTSSSETDPTESSCGPETTRSLASSLERSRYECTRLNRLLAQSQSRILELERQMAEQESEFERVAERVQEKLKDQRSKMLQAQSQIEQLQSELEEVRMVERTTKQELAEERRKLQELAGSSERRKKKPSHERLHPRSREAKTRENSDVASSSSADAASVGSSKRLPAGGPKDPFN